MSRHIRRREFIPRSAGFAVLAGASPLTIPTSGAPEPAQSRKTIGIQIGAVSFVDEGTEKASEILQERGAVDTIYLTTFAYGRGLAGR